MATCMVLVSEICIIVSVWVVNRPESAHLLPEVSKVSKFPGPDVYHFNVTAAASSFGTL